MPLGTNWASHHQYLDAYHLNKMASLRDLAEIRPLKEHCRCCVAEHWALAVWIWPSLIIILTSPNLSFLICKISCPCPTDHAGFGGGSNEIRGMVTLWMRMYQTNIALLFLSFAAGALRDISKHFLFVQEGLALE